MLNTRKLGSGLCRAVAALGTALGFFAIQPTEAFARDVGNIGQADIVIPEGTASLHLELVPDLVMVRPGSEGIRGAGLLETFRHSSESLLLARAVETPETSLVDHTLKSTDAGFAGPVFYLGGRTVATGDTLVLEVSSDVTPARLQEIAAAHNMELLKSYFDTVHVFRVNTRSGYETINTVTELHDEPGVQSAAVNWFSQYELNNYTSRYGGTSAAAANTAGVVALVRDFRPDLDVDQVIQVIKQTANNGSSSTDAEEGFEYETLTEGWAEGQLIVRDNNLLPQLILEDDQITTNTKRRGNAYGYGVVNAYDAVNYALNITPNIDGLPGDYAGRVNLILVKGEDEPTTPPAVVFTSPTGNIRVSSGTTSRTIEGDAIAGTDALTITSLQWRLNDGPFQNINLRKGGGSTIEPFSFSASPLQPGFNVVEVRTTDSGGGEGSNSLGIYRRKNAFSQPNDPLYPFQWHLGIPGAADGREALTGSADMDVVDTWSAFDYPNPETSSVRIAIIDDGVATNLPFGELNIYSQYNTCFGQNLPARPAQFDSSQPRSGTGHGTSAASIIAASANNGYGGVGILPGYPIIAIRAATTDDGSLFLQSDCDFLDAFSSAVSDGASVICVGIGPVLSDGLCFESDINVGKSFPVTKGIGFGVGGAYSNDVPVVWAAGNRRDSTDLYSLFEFYGSIATDDIDEETGGLIDRGREAILVVGASSSIVGLGLESGPLLGISHYSNRDGDSLSVVAPSSDFWPDYEPCATTVSDTFLTIGIVASDTNLFSMGGEVFDRQTPDPEIPIPVKVPPAGTVGIKNYETISLLYDSDQDGSGPLGRGIIFYVDGGAIELYPDGLVQDETGSIFGFVTILVRDDNNVITNQITLNGVTGKIKGRQSGKVSEREKVAISISLRGRDSAGNQIKVSMKQKYTLIDEILRGTGGGGTAQKVQKIFPAPPPDNNGPRPPDSTAFKVKAQVKFAGGGRAKTTGRVLMSTLDDAPGATEAKLDYALASIYSSDIETGGFAPTGVTGFTRWTGSATVDSPYDFQTSSGNLDLRVLFSPPTIRGKYKAKAQVGSYRAKTQGVHTSPNSNPLLPVADISNFPEKVSVRTPAFSTNLSNAIPAGFLGTDDIFN